MAWRFKASKYKNAAPLVPKPENCIRDISVGSYQTYGNNITASAMFMAFNVDHAGELDIISNNQIFLLSTYFNSCLFVGLHSLDIQLEKVEPYLEGE